MKSAFVLLFLFVLHTLPLWDAGNKLVGGIEDPAAQASIPGFYCSKILFWDFHDNRFFAPEGASLANSYDSPFPMILTCPFVGLSSHAKFHLFAGLHVFLVLLCSWLVALVLFPRSWIWQLVYVGFAWWTGFYVTRIHQHYTLLAGIWGFQLLLWMFLTVDWRNRGRSLLYGVLGGLVFCGTIHNVAMLSVPALILLGFSLRGRERAAYINAALSVVVSAFVFLLFFAPSLTGFFEGELLRVPADRAKYGFDLLGPFLPWAHSRLYDWFGVRPHASLERYNPFDILVVAAFIYFVIRKRLLGLPLVKPLLWIALFAWVYSLGPVIHIYHQDLFANPLDTLFANIPPFSISRTPSRFATLTFLSILFLAAAAVARMQTPKWLAPVLLVWILASGPWLNARPQLPYAEFRHFLPMRALSEVAAMPADTFVLNVPTYFSGDPTQNFLQLFHHKPISAGYLSYVAHSAALLNRFGSDPVRSQMNCEGHLFPFTGGGIVSNPEALRAHLLNTHFRVIIVNKLALGDPACEKLFTWVRTLSQYPWIRVMEESKLYAVLAVQ